MVNLFLGNANFESEPTYDMVRLDYDSGLHSPAVDKDVQ